MTRDETTRVASSMSQVNPGETSFCLARRLRASLAAAAETPSAAWASPEEK